MNEKKARELLKAYIGPDDSLNGRGFIYISWRPGDGDVTIDGRVTAEELRAILWWVENKAA